MVGSPFPSAGRPTVYESGPLCVCSHPRYWHCRQGTDYCELTSCACRMFQPRSRGECYRPAAAGNISRRAALHADAE